MLVLCDFMATWRFKKKLTLIRRRSGRIFLLVLKYKYYSNRETLLLFEYFTNLAEAKRQIER